MTISWIRLEIWAKIVAEAEFIPRSRETPNTLRLIGFKLMTTDRKGCL
jgi:hypothetical protein